MAEPSRKVPQGREFGTCDLSSRPADPGQKRRSLRTLTAPLRSTRQSSSSQSPEDLPVGKPVTRLFKPRLPFEPLGAEYTWQNTQSATRGERGQASTYPFLLLRKEATRCLLRRTTGSRKPGAHLAAVSLEGGPKAPIGRCSQAFPCGDMATEVTCQQSRWTTLNQAGDLKRIVSLAGGGTWDR